MYLYYIVMTWTGPGGRGLRSDRLAVAYSRFVHTPQEDIIFVLRGGPLDLEVRITVDCRVPGKRGLH